LKPGTPPDLIDLAVARELLRRKRAQTSLHSYFLSIQVPLSPNGPLDLDEELMGPAHLLMPLHLSVILATLERTMNRPFGRCMIFAPPGSAKSSCASVVAPSWEMGRKPKSRIILTSYAADLAERQPHARCRERLGPQQRVGDAGRRIAGRHYR